VTEHGYTVGSTFTGVGGADLGLERSGFRISWQCEIDMWKRSVLRAHWPGIPIYDDITTLNDPPRVDVLVGGFPCQDLSMAGKRRGFDGDRSILAFQFLRIADAIQPRWLLLENVPGLLSSNDGRDFARLVDEMVGCGYGVAWGVFDARRFVPQRRRRVFVVGRRVGVDGDPRIAARRAFHVVGEGGGGDHPACGTSRLGSAASVDGRIDGGAWAFSHTQGLDIQASQSHWPTLRKNGGGHAVAIPAADPNDPMTLRRLTPIECERIMGWPDNWTAPPGVHAPDGRRYAACGDGIVAPVAEYIGRQMLNVDAGRLDD
jgi:DNA (cytosine-5)-methyltransferase 1